jgi:glutathione S-transferase
MPALKLHQFPISHYCEKVRWVLDYKQLPYTVKNQLPGLHVLVNKRLVGDPTVPVLIDGHHAIGSSNAIALYLDDQYPERKLIPSSGRARSEVLALEAFFDENLGVASRRYVYSYVLRDLRLFKQVFFRDYDPVSRLMGGMMAAAVTKQIGKMYKVGDVGIAESVKTIEEAMRRVEQLIRGDARRYLVGDALTLADLTAASLLAPLVAPRDSPWSMPIEAPELLSYRAELRARPAGQWVLARYAADRRVVSAAAT